MQQAIRYAIVFTSVSLLTGCQLAAVGLFGMPDWNCVRAKEPIELFEQLDVSGEKPQLVNPSGVFDTGAGARILDRHKDSRKTTTHFRIRTQNDIKGWFAWQGSNITGSTNSKCW